MWFLFASLASILFAINSLLGRVLAVESSNPRAFAFVYNTYGAIFVLGYFLFDRTPFSRVPLPIIFLTLLTIILYGIFNRYEYYARKYVEASTLSILFRVTPVITFIGATLLLGEPLTAYKVIAGVLIVGGSIFAVAGKKGIVLGRGGWYACVVIIALGLAWLVDKKASVYWPLPFYAFLSYFPTNVFLYFFPKLSAAELMKEVRIGSGKIVLLSFINVAAYYSLIKAFSTGEASRVALITSTSTIVTVLAGIVLLGERNHIGRKLLATAIVMIGVLLLR